MFRALKDVFPAGFHAFAAVFHRDFTWISSEAHDDQRADQAHVERLLHVEEVNGDGQHQGAVDGAPLNVHIGQPRVYLGST